MTDPEAGMLHCPACAHRYGTGCGCECCAGRMPVQHDECTCEGRPRHIHHPWGWREGKRIAYLDAP